MKVVSRRGLNLRNAVLAAGAAGLLGAFMAPPAAASGTPLTITADMPAAVPAGHNWGFNNFYPRTLSVARGSKIQFAVEGFHTATLLPRSVSVSADLLAHGVATPDEDATRNLNGTTHTNLRVAGLLPKPATCGSTTNPCTFSGASTISSGVPFNGPPAPWVVKVTARPGVYTFHCRVHQFMVGQLNVLPSGSQGTTPAQLTNLVNLQVAADVRNARQTERARNFATGVQNANGTTTWTMLAGAETANHRVAILEFLPRNLHVLAGDRVVWRLTGDSEPHTITFPGELFTDLAALCESGATDTVATPLHMPPQGPFDFTCGGGRPPDEIEFGGGNGSHAVTSTSSVVDSGVLFTDGFSDRFGVPDSATRSHYTVRFNAAAGAYTYVCQIHFGMAGMVTVHI